MEVATKTLTPTGQVVYLPNMTEKPNASVLIDGIGKDADAINALNSKLEWKTGNSTTDKTASIGVPETANEAIVRVMIRSGIYFNFHFNKNELNTQNACFYDIGSYFSSQAYGCRLKVWNYSFAIDGIYIGAGTEDFKMEIFYR